MTPPELLSRDRDRGGLRHADGRRGALIDRTPFLRDGYALLLPRDRRLAKCESAALTLVALAATGCMSRSGLGKSDYGPRRPTSRSPISIRNSEALTQAWTLHCPPGGTLPDGGRRVASSARSSDPFAPSPRAPPARRSTAGLRSPTSAARSTASLSTRSSAEETAASSNAGSASASSSPASADHTSGPMAPPSHALPGQPGRRRVDERAGAAQARRRRARSSSSTRSRSALTRRTGTRSVRVQGLLRQQLVPVARASRSSCRRRTSSTSTSGSRSSRSGSSSRSSRRRAASRCSTSSAPTSASIRRSSSCTACKADARVVGSYAALRFIPFDAEVLPPGLDLSALRAGPAGRARPGADRARALESGEEGHRAGDRGLQGSSRSISTSSTASVNEQALERYKRGRHRRRPGAARLARRLHDRGDGPRQAGGHLARRGRGAPDRGGVRRQGADRARRRRTTSSSSSGRSSSRSRSAGAWRGGRAPTSRRCTTSSAMTDRLLDALRSPVSGPRRRDQAARQALCDLRHRRPHPADRRRPPAPALHPLPLAVRLRRDRGARRAVGGHLRAAPGGDQSSFFRFYFHAETDAERLTVVRTSFWFTMGAATIAPACRRALRARRSQHVPLRLRRARRPRRAPRSSVSGRR